MGRGASCTLGRSGGANGWYTTPVTLSVSATDIATGVAETRCALDAASATFAAFPSACAAPVAAGPAYDFPLGTNTAGPVTASDKAANATTKSTTFTVKVTPTSLCTLTKRFVQGSMKYQALPPGAQAFVDMRWAATCQTLDAIVPGLSPFEKTALINAYQATVDVLAAPFQGWLTSRQAATLKTLAAAP